MLSNTVAFGLHVLQKNDITVMCELSNNAPKHVLHSSVHSVIYAFTAKTFQYAFSVVCC